jgi:hypothetical protein
MCVRRFVRASRPWLCCKFWKNKEYLIWCEQYLMMSLFSTSPFPRGILRTNCSLSMRLCHLIKLVQYRVACTCRMWERSPLTFSHNLSTSRQCMQYTSFHASFHSVEYGLGSIVRCSNSCVISVVRTFRCSFAFVIRWNSLRRVCWCLIVARVWVRAYTWGDWEIVWVFRWTIELLV